MQWQLVMAVPAMLVAVGLASCRPPMPTVAKVELAAVSNPTAEAPTVQEVLADLGQAEEAIEARTLDGLTAAEDRSANETDSGSTVPRFSSCPSMSAEAFELILAGAALADPSPRRVLAASPAVR
jgi:hypothetical protein